jgi:tricorn protease
MEKALPFSGNYDGNNDAYTIPVNGGVPVRLTSHGYSDRVVDWTTDGKKVLFASAVKVVKQDSTSSIQCRPAVVLLKNFL